MRNWARFFRSSEYGNSDKDFKTDNSSEGIDIDKIPDEKTVKQRVDDYHRRYGETSSEVYVTKGVVPKYSDPEFDKSIREMASQAEASANINDARTDHVLDSNSDYMEVDDKMKEKFAKEKHWPKSWNNPESREEYPRVVDNKRNRIPQKKNNEAIVPRDIESAQDSGDKYNNMFE